ncbi:hypothetical protein K1T71_001563 [Dendrolimus kikuchii]|uniref:Uncharacterized protein n=1 Tax=Dendrolimus kikuchii TaxID=765133 RepID=A0ACC1DE04_9NEOP|nr:hypothetical protein K1T71_001563 [Dendrolimus kikuchii]
MGALRCGARALAAVFVLVSPDAIIIAMLVRAAGLGVYQGGSATTSSAGSLQFRLHIDS